MQSTVGHVGVWIHSQVHCSHCALEAKWQDPRIESAANGAQRKSALFWSKELVLNAPGHFQEFEAV